MEIDLYRDWVAYLRNELTVFGYDTTQMQEHEDIIHTYLNLIKRLIQPFPRTVLRSKAFTCPGNELSGLAEVERKITVGEDLSPHLSRLLRNPSFNDQLLNDWGIYHVHLGTTLDSDGFVRRSGPVLFARFDNTHAYFIDVLPHGSWNLQRLVKDIHENWPESICRYRLNKVSGLSRPITDDCVKKLRRGHVNTLIDLGGGIVYAPLGGGYSTSGLSTEVVIQGDYCAMRLRQMQQTVIDNIETIAASARKIGLTFPDYPQFGLKVEEGKLFAVEVNCMISIPIGRL